MTNAQHQRPPPMRIVLAVDGSEHSRAGAALVAGLPLPPGSEVAALGVLTPRQTPGRAALLAALDEVAEVLAGAGKQAHTGLLHGQPAQALTEFTNKHRPDLLVVGARGLRATLGILLGGVAQQVVEHAQAPVLVVRAPAGQLRRVLVAVDGSPAGAQAVEFLARLPLPAGVTLEAMHVVPPLPPPEVLVATRPVHGQMLSPSAASAFDQAAARQAQVEEEHGRQLLARAAATLEAAGLEAGQVLVRGDAATEILEHVQRQNVDLVAAGSRGLSALSGWLLGSVSRKLVHYAGCSVLITPEPEGKAQAWT